jgi:ArsR family transcriptional regulator
MSGIVQMGQVTSVSTPRFYQGTVTARDCDGRGGAGPSGAVNGAGRFRICQNRQMCGGLVAWGTRRPPEEASPVNRPIYQVKADFFKTLAHPARIRVLELLRGGELSVGAMIPDVGIEASHLSQQLAVLRRTNIVQTRKEGSTVLYSVADPRIFELLELTKSILTTSLSETRDLLAELATLDFVDGPTRAGSAEKR